jgi:hypothetical protein
MSVESMNVNNRQLSNALSKVGFRDSSVGSIEGNRIYTNDDIKSNFRDIILSQDLLKPVVKNIIRLIDSDRIIPVHVSEGILRKIKKIFSSSTKNHARSKYGLAFFDHATRKVYILLEEVQNVKFWTKEDSVSLVLLHEMQHMSATLLPNAFISLHIKSMVKYYTLFFKLYFDINIDKKDALLLAKWLHSRTEKGKTRNLLLDYYALINKILKRAGVEKETANSMSISYMTQVKSYLLTPKKWIDSLMSRSAEPYKLFYALYKSYRALNILKIDSICIQETVFPGEIICIESEFNTQSRHFSLIPKIR